MAQASATRLGFRRGGRVHGPGTETSDSIPALLSDGEYVLPADTVRAVGVKNLDKLKNATHTPAGKAMGFVPGFADGGVMGLIGQDRIDRQNAEASASSIVKDATQQGAEQRLSAMNAPALQAAQPAPQAVQPTAGVIGGDRLNQQNQATAASSIAKPAPTAEPSAAQSLAAKPVTQPVSTAPVTRVGNSFSNFNATNEDPAYRGLKMDTNNPGNQRAMQSISPFAARGFANGGLAEDESKRLLSQIPGSSPEGWVGGTGEQVTGSEFSRNLNNATNAIAPLTAGGSLVARTAMVADKAGSLGFMAKPAVQSALAYGVPATGAVALMSAASKPQDQTNKSSTSGLTTAGDATMPGNDPARFAIQDKTSAPDGSPTTTDAEAPTQQVQQQAVRPAQVAPPQAPAGFIPAQIRHSGNDWEARNNLRNLQVSASSITEKDDPNSPAVLAYKSALATDQALREGKNPAVESQNRDAAFMDRTQAGEGAANYRAQVANSIAQQKLTQDGMRLGFEADAAKRKAKMDEQLLALQSAIANDDGKDPKRTAMLQEKLQTITGKYQRPDAASRLTVVNRPDIMAADGMTKLGGGQAVVVQNADGSLREVPIGGGQSQSQGVPEPKSKAEYDALPKGSQYMKDGVLKTKA